MQWSAYRTPSCPFAMLHSHLRPGMCRSARTRNLSVTVAATRVGEEGRINSRVESGRRVASGREVLPGGESASAPRSWTKGEGMSKRLRVVLIGAVSALLLFPAGAAPGVNPH